MSKVSVIITTCNRLELLRRAIDSVRKQTYQDIELIVVSDGSTDGTSDYCHSLTGLKFIDIPEEERNGGNHARNVGVQSAKGEYVAFLDDDDYWLPEKIEKQVALIEEGGFGLVSCGMVVENVLHDGSVTQIGRKEGFMPYADMSRNIMYNICAQTSQILVRKSILEQVGLFDEKLMAWQEYELMMRMAQGGVTFGAVKDCLVVYRINEYDNQKITNKLECWRESVEYIYQKHAALYARLSFIEKLEVRFLYYADAAMRARNCSRNDIAVTFERKCKFYRRLVKLLRILTGG